MYSNKDFEIDLLISEQKGILMRLQKLIEETRFSLASDNVGKLTDETAKMKMFINKIDEKTNNYNKRKTN